MALLIDPAGNEIRALERAANWRGKRVLEAGCGDGRLTLRIAALGAGEIHAVDPDRELIREARRNLPKRYAGRIEYRVGQAEKLTHASNAFDIVLFSWVL